MVRGVKRNCESDLSWIANRVKNTNRTRNVNKIRNVNKRRNTVRIKIQFYKIEII